MVDILLQNLPQILTAVLAIGIVWKYLGKVLVILKEISEALVAITTALADKTITKDEMDTIVKEMKDIPKAIKDAFKK